MYVIFRIVQRKLYFLCSGLPSVKDDAVRFTMRALMSTYRAEAVEPLELFGCFSALLRP